MYFKYTLKQLLRTPLKTILFILLIAASTAFLTIGLNLWNSSCHNIKDIENTFTTIGTIEQRHDSMQIGKGWSSYEMKYIQYDYPIYSREVGLDELSGLPFLVTPEKRSFYTAHVPKLHDALFSGIEHRLLKQSVFEFEPIEDFDVTEKTRVKITNIFYSWGGELVVEKMKTPYFYSASESFMNMDNPDKPMRLEVGKRYITVASDVLIEETEEHQIWGYMAVDGIGEIQSDGGYSCASPAITEVTDGFYETEIGKQYLEEVNWLKRMEDIVPVLPTKDINLFMPFFNGEAKVTEGLAFTKEQYQSGERICLISQAMAQQAALSIGDEIELNLYEVNNDLPSSQFFSPGGSGGYYAKAFQNGKIVPYFQTANYKIVGIYTYNNVTTEPTGYELGLNSIIIPTNSVEKLEKAFVSMQGPMRGSTTSFSIKNGTAEKFMGEFSKLKLANIDIRFYDKGYTKIIGGLREMQKMSFTLLFASGVCTVGILLLFVFLQISRKKREAAISLSLGIKKKQCAAILMQSVLLVVTIGCIFGAVAGHFLSETVYEKTLTTAKKTAFDTYYSDTVNAADLEAQIHSSHKSDIMMTLSAVMLVLAVSGLLALTFTRQALKCEPMKLLSEKKE